MNNWYNPLPQKINLSVLTKTLPTKGNMAWEYNPFRNYRLSKDMYEYDGDLYTEKELTVNYGLYWNDSASYLGKSDNTGAWQLKVKGTFESIKEVDAPILREKGELVDFITDELNFSLNNPVTILPQYSYDGSVNLILTDGLNPPRMINSRFSATGKSTYEIVDRAGSNDTNIYDQGAQFDIDTSLYKRVKTIPKLELKSVNLGGNLKCGNYHFYFKLADADGNETDFVAESGLVSIFIGQDYPDAIYTGNKNENAAKQITFSLTKIDPSYPYVYVYYSRYTAEDGDNMITEYKKIDKKYTVNNFQKATILITGEEDTDNITASEINLNYNIVDAAHCAVTAKSMLFLGNIHKPTIDQETFKDLSLRFLPYLKEEPYVLDINESYKISSTNKGYYSPLYIYNNTGYWDQELYRLGIVYILSNGTLSEVFNIRGRENLTVFSKNTKSTDSAITTVYDDQYSYYRFETNEEDPQTVKIQTNETTHLLLQPSSEEGFTAKNSATYENSKGVISLKSSDDTNSVHLIEIRVEEETLKRLRALGVQGFFFVRQTRIPLVLSQGIAIGLDKTGRVPTIPTQNGILDELAEELDGSTYVETKNIYGNNFVSEGFLSRYSFELKAKKSSLWKKIGKAVACAAVVAAGVCGAVFTGGASLAASVCGVVGITGSAVAAAGTAIATGLVVGAVVTTTAATLAAVATIQDIHYAISRQTHSKELKGRNTDIASGYYRKELDDSRRLGYSFKSRLIIKDYTKNEVGAMLCPDYDVNPQKYNQYFTGNEFTLYPAKSQAITQAFINDYNNGQVIKQGYNFINDSRHFYIPRNAYGNVSSPLVYSARILGIPDDTACLTIGTSKFRSKAGNSSEAWRYECIGDDWKQEGSYVSEDADEEAQATSTEVLTSDQVDQELSDKEINSDIVRGSYGPYLAMTDFTGNVGTTLNIMIPGYSSTQLETYINIRMQDSSPYYAVSDRIDINSLDDFYFSKSKLASTSQNLNCKFTIARGDCYICQFTHRLNRNFNSETSPYNSDIVDTKSWKTNYKVSESEKFEKINLGDVNAVNLGMWVTFSVRSSMNLNIRSLDSSITAETAQMGHPRGFFPYQGMVAEGSHKSAEALVYNAGFTKSVSERYNLTAPDVPANKNWFGTRIMYSDIQSNDSYTNGFRVFQGQNYKDYTREYGEITKLLNYKDNIFVVFEHGLAILAVNERSVAAQGAGGEVYINSNNVLPEALNVISGSYGSLWADSVLLVPSDGAVNDTMIFGVDTSAKKIWVYSGGSSIKLISDYKVQEFLNNNLTLSERETTPLLGIRNVKTSYNAFKHDVMFTFYDDLSGIQEKVWNLCYNVLSYPGPMFTTFYSWVPSFMENINNIPFSFNRDVSKWIAKLGQTHAENSFASGITLSQNIYNNDGTVDGTPYFTYRYQTITGEYKEYTQYITADEALIGILNLQNQILPEGDNITYMVIYELLRDIYGYYKHFKIKKVANVKIPKDAKITDVNIPIFGLYFEESTIQIETESQNATSTLQENEYIDINSLYASNYNMHFSELYYRNKNGNSYNDYDCNKVTIGDAVMYNGEPCMLTKDNYFTIIQELNLPIFHNRAGCRVPLAAPINKKYLVQILNIRATIYAHWGNSNETTLQEYMQSLKASTTQQSEYSERDTSQEISLSGWTNAGAYESSVAITSKWNLQFLSSDFWKHGQAGVIDNTEDILPTKWYGEQHPFEFEVIVNDQIATQKIFQNLEIIANKAKPESFHFEIVGESYDFAKDKINMYFRQEARKALFQYNGCDIEYNNNFLKLSPKQQPRSAELVYNYYERQDTLEDIYDTYTGDAINSNKYNTLNTYAYDNNYSYWANLSPNKDYRHLSGAEIVYYPTRQEFRIWQHQPAINIDELSQDTATSIVKANCQYLEDKWRVSINPLLICYKNEYKRNITGALCQPENSTWPNAQDAYHNKSDAKLPPITLMNTCLPDAISTAQKVNFPDESKLEGKDNALYGLYSWEGELPVDGTNWLDDVSVYKTTFGTAQNRKETDLRDKFIKIRIRYSGEELAIIDFLNTIYTLSYV